MAHTYKPVYTGIVSIAPPHKLLYRAVMQRLCCFVAQHDFAVVIEHETPIEIICTHCNKNLKLNINRARGR